MDRSRAAEVWPVLKAYAEGKPIEVYSRKMGSLWPENQWVPADTVYVNEEVFPYRVKEVSSEEIEKKVKETEKTFKEALAKIGFKNMNELVEAATTCKMAQHYRDRMYEEHRDFLATLVSIRRDFGNNPAKFIEEVNQYIDFWEECCDWTDGKILDYKGEES